MSILNYCVIFLISNVLIVTICTVLEKDSFIKTILEYLFRMSILIIIACIIFEINSIVNQLGVIIA